MNESVDKCSVISSNYSPKSTLILSSMYSLNLVCIRVILANICVYCRLSTDSKCLETVFALKEFIVW